MALINRPMYEHFGARHLGVKGPGALTTLEEGVMGVLPLDMSSDPAYWYIQGIRVFIADIDQAAGGAGTFAKIGLSIETAAPEVLIRILGAFISLPGTTGDNISMYRCARTAFSSDPGVYGYSTDTRIAEGQHSQGILINGTDNTHPGQVLARKVVGLHEDYATNTPLIVSPGEAIYWTPASGNTAIQLCLCWAEIPAYKAEL